jgi:hypothetical protein
VRRFFLNGVHVMLVVLALLTIVLWSYSYYASEIIGRLTQDQLWQVQLTKGQMGFYIDTIYDSRASYQGFQPYGFFHSKRWIPPAGFPPLAATTGADFHWTLAGFEMASVHPVAWPSITRFVAAPMWFVAIFFLTGPAVKVLRLLRDRNNPVGGKCATCGYDIRHSYGRCPECGSAVSSAATFGPSDQS